MKLDKERVRAAITRVLPQVEEGRFPIKRIIGDEITISADIFTDSHHLVAANLLFQHEKENDWQEVAMTKGLNDSWKGSFFAEKLGLYFFTLHAWVDDFATWQQEIIKKINAGLAIKGEIEWGIRFLEQSTALEDLADIQSFIKAIKKSKNETQQAQWAIATELSLLMRDRFPNKQWITQWDKEIPIVVDPPKARFSSWYEMFPRSLASDGSSHGTFKDCQQLLPEIAEMGFNVLYFPPIHPIGYSKRKGKSNELKAGPDDPGSPWAIGSHEGGHRSIHPQLGTFADFDDLVSSARSWNIDIALDIALQCSPDHPYIKEHPEWFCWRPDGTIQYAENPPKKYEDIVPFYFETKDWKALWKELRRIFLFWIKKGVKIFRIDNPHTKPFAFWEWIISSIKKDYPDVLFLCEAFTRPQVMDWLSKLGFSQSYTYFTWRHTKQELTEYLTEIVLTDKRDYFRPNLWTNTPDILTEELQQGGKAVFMSRLVLAATLSSNYGMYAPAFELMESKAKYGTEDYLLSEKYQFVQWNYEQENLKNFITQINQIRNHLDSLQHTSNLKFLEIDNDQILYYGKFSQELNSNCLVLVNLNPFHSQSGKFKIPLNDLSLIKKGSYTVHELLLNHFYIWEGEFQTITLDPQMPASIFVIQKATFKESQFDYF